MEHPDAFWNLVWDEVGVIGDKGRPAYQHVDGPFHRARFFPEARLSFAENLIEHGASDQEPALIAVREGADDSVWTRGELRAEVAAVAAALTADGVRAGDRVAALMPNVAETVIVMLATTAIGAIFTSTSPDFGVQAVVDRFGQVDPAVLVACDGYRYQGRDFDISGRVDEVARQIPSLRRTVIVPTRVTGLDREVAGRATEYEEWVAPHRGAALVYERWGFDQPGFILYSSGTTGPPKCILHRAAGVLLTHMKEHQLHCDVRPGDRVLYFTTCGWMMWNWLTSVLASGATAVLYDGSPVHPTDDTLFDIVDRWDVSLLGVSAKLIDSHRAVGLEPCRSHRLERLRTICSTGSPLKPAAFDYVYRSVKSDVHLASISGGTDLCGCLVIGDPRREVWPGEIQGPALGMDIAILDDDGVALPPDVSGELVCRRPFPSMPLGMWNDPDDRRLSATYFERFPGVWHHGDFARWTRHGGIVVEGRSDSTLNVAGVRIGTAEIYRVIDGLPEVTECVAVGQTWGDDSRIVLLLVMAEGQVLDEALEQRIRSTLRTRCSPRHVPQVIVQVSELPRTYNGKLSEIAVVDVVNGRPARNRDALANPHSLEEIPGKVPGDTDRARGT